MKMIAVTINPDDFREVEMSKLQALLKTRIKSELESRNLSDFDVSINFGDCFLVTVIPDDNEIGRTPITEGYVKEIYDNLVDDLQLKQDEILKNKK